MSDFLGLASELRDILAVAALLLVLIPKAFLAVAKSEAARGDEGADP